MKISIAQRFHPFSHRSGTECLLPLSTWQATIYPARVVLKKMGDSSQCVTLDLAIQGPLQDFTAEVDLEKGVIRVFGRAKQGFLRYEIFRVSEGICFKFDKLPSAKVKCVQTEWKINHELSEKGTLLIPVVAEAEFGEIPQTRLSLGMHKAQDWDLVLRRFDLKEIFPILIRLGAMIPGKTGSYEPHGTFALLSAFQSACAERKKLEVLAACERWLQASFTGILVPTSIDQLFQGILPSSESIPNDSTLLSHLIVGSQAILSLFFQESPQCWDILPCLLPPFAAGRLVNLATQQKEILGMEWSKHQLKKLIVQTSQPRIQNLRFPKEIRSFRVRRSLQEKGRVVVVESGCATIELPSSSRLFLDRFQK